MTMIKLEITTESAKAMLPILEQQCEELRGQLVGAEKQVTKLRQEIAAASGHSVKQEPLPMTFSPKKTKEGRAKKGESESAIANYLQTVNGQGASTTSISTSAGTKYGTTYRILKHMRGKGSVRQVNDLWFWKT